MVSITHCWKRVLPDRSRRRVLLLALLLLAGAAWGEGITYKAVSIGEDGGKILLDIIEEYRLTPTMLEALRNGVPLTFATRVKLTPDNSWFWQSPLAERILRRKLRYHPLAGSYEVWDSLTDRSRFFATPEAALVALGDIKGWEVADASRLEPGRSYHISIESWHDIGSLPLPLRPKAYLSPGWHLSSKVYEWRLRP